MIGFSSLMQAHLFRNRRRKLGLRLGDGLKVWAPGIVVTKGQYIRTAGADLGSIGFFIATGNGTTGATSPLPNNRAVQSDGAVNWQQVDSQIFLTLQPPISTPA